jgi:hypothetical protein
MVGNCKSLDTNRHSHLARRFNRNDLFFVKSPLPLPDCRDSASRHSIGKVCDSTLSRVSRIESGAGIPAD